MDFDDKNIFIVCDMEGKLNEWIKLFKSTLKGHQTLFIIDDCSAEGEINRKRDALSELAFSGRRRNHFYLLTNWFAYLYGRIQSPRPDVMPNRREGVTRATGFVFACIDMQTS